MRKLEQISKNLIVRTIEIGEDGGSFEIKSRGVNLFIIASFGAGWDHVSVSCDFRCPTWEDMCLVKSIFFRDDETVIQYHPKKSEYVNLHTFCLHLWKPQNSEIPTPPKILV